MTHRDYAGITPSQLDRSVSSTADMALESAKNMPELSMLTILIQAAAIVKNKSGDRSLHGYVEDHGPASRRVMESDEIEVEFAVLDSIGDILLQNSQVLAISPNMQMREHGRGITILTPAESELELPAEHPIGTGALKVSGINASVVPNPNDRHAGNRKSSQSGGPLGNIRQVIDGKSMWEEVKKDPLCYAVNMDVSTPTGLANHAETVCDYLYEYGREVHERSQYSTLFFQYLLSACWEKIYRRFSSWRALGLLRNFEERIDLLKGHLNLIGTPAGPIENFTQRGPGDRSLIQLLYWNKSVFDMLQKVLPHDNTAQSVFEKLREVVDHAFQDDLTPLYTKETALGFHHLVYGAFLLAAHAIRMIKDGRRPLNQEKAEKKQEYPSQVENFKKCLAAAVLPMKVLQSVLSSTAFKRHIGVWTNDGESVGELYPIWSQRTVNMTFGKDRQILSKLKQGPSEESPTNDGEDDDDCDDNMPEMMGSPESKLQMFFGWVRTFVAHFLGKRNLEVYSARLASLENKRPEIRVFAVNSELYRVPSWEEFENVIRNALQGTSDSEKNQIIRNLQEKVSSGKGLKHEAVRLLSIFRRMMKGELKTYSLYMHCEAVIAALLECAPDSDDTLANLSKNLAKDIVSVSKLCCPVCWELFQVLQMEKAIRGCHPSVTPTVLPETLPNHVSEAMVTRFRAHLSGQLRHLLSSNTVPMLMAQHRRNDSESGYSAASSQGSAKEYPDAYQAWSIMNL
jgi:hypothetical protein